MTQCHSGPCSQYPARVLAVTPFNDDLLTLQAILGSSECKLEQARSFSEAIEALQGSSCAVVICERELTDGDWRDLLPAAAESRPDPARLIVAARHPDERFWSEVLEFGGYDVLSKPFRNDEVLRTVGLACLCASARSGRDRLRARTAL